MSVLRVSSENFFQGALNQRQLDEHEHRFKRLRSQCFPAAVVNASSRREKERPSLDPMRNPGPVAFPLLKLGSPDMVHVINGSLTAGRCTKSTMRGEAMIHALRSRHAAHRQT